MNNQPNEAAAINTLPPCPWCGAAPKSTLGSMGNLWVECMTEGCPLFRMAAMKAEEWRSFRPTGSPEISSLRSALAAAEKRAEEVGLSYLGLRNDRDQARTERDRLAAQLAEARGALARIAGLDYRNAATNGAAYSAHQIASAFLAPPSDRGAEGEDGEITSWSDSGKRVSVYRCGLAVATDDASGGSVTQCLSFREVHNALSAPSPSAPVEVTDSMVALAQIAQAESIAEQSDEMGKRVDYMIAMRAALAAALKGKP